jgi:hypothetical protein
MSGDSVGSVHGDSRGHFLALALSKIPLQRTLVFKERPFKEPSAGWLATGQWRCAVKEQRWLAGRLAASISADLEAEGGAGGRNNPPSSTSFFVVFVLLYPSSSSIPAITIETCFYFAVT